MGTVDDLYDFKTHTNDDVNGWASRVQVCHTASRDPGEIFRVEVSLNIVVESQYDDPPCSDINAIKDVWAI